MSPADLSAKQYYELFEDLQEFRGWLAGYRDILREAPDSEKSRIQREEINRVIDEYDRRVNIE
jgi:uncharacterized protein YdiU (UPF0061 family)